MPCYIRYLLSAVHTTWSDLNFAVGLRWRMKMEGRETWKQRVRRRKGAARSRDVVSLSLSLNCYLPAGSGVFNLTLYSTIWEFIATSTRDCSGIKWLICLCYPRPIRGEHNFLVCQEIFLWASLYTSLDRLTLALDNWLKAKQSFLTPMTRQWTIWPLLDLLGCNSLEHCFVLRPFY